MSEKLTVITNGDSWVFGCEIVDPKISARYSASDHPGKYDYTEENDAYRLPRIFPTHLSTLLDADVINLSWPADDNGSILRRTLNYIIDRYISKNRSTENLLVILGWSSPERNSFWYKDYQISRPFRLWPQVQHFDADPQKEFWKLYVQHMWNREEYIPRYILNVIQLQNFCDANNIRWLCFNSFYQSPNKNVTDWEELDVRHETESLGPKLGTYPYTNTLTGSYRHHGRMSYIEMWNTVDPIRFYKKDQANNTFKSFIEDPVNNIGTIFNGWHPSPESHEAWAKELARYISENKLI